LQRVFENPQEDGVAPRDQRLDLGKAAVADYLLAAQGSMPVGR
jgi:hypothetical protein